MNETTPEPQIPGRIEVDLRALERAHQRTQDTIKLVTGIIERKGTTAVCPLCKGPSTFREEESVRRTMEARRKDPEAGALLIPALCAKCTKAAIREAKTNVAIRNGIPGNLAGMDWDSWIAEGQEDTTAATLAKVYTRCASPTPILYIYGLVGTGKSSLAVCMCKQWTSSFLWTNQVDFMRKVRAQYQRTYEPTPDPVPIYARPTLLVFDEFGLMGGGRDEITNTYALLNERIGKGRLTVITSNKAPDELREAMGEPIIDRIQANAQIVKLKRKKR